MSYLDAEDLDGLLTVLRKHDVSVYKDGEFVVQLAPKVPEFGTEVDPVAEAGGWKRRPNLME